MKITFTAIALAAMLATGAQAANDSGTYRTFGPYSCGDVVKLRRTGQDGYIRAWLRGYMTARNRTANGIVDILGDRDIREVYPWTETWCLQNPTDNLAHAAEAFAREAIMITCLGRESYPGMELTGRQVDCLDGFPGNTAKQQLPAS